MTLIEILKSFYECIAKVGEEGLRVRRREMRESPLSSSFSFLFTSPGFYCFMQYIGGRKVILHD